MKRILCYGDSNTYGVNPASTPENDEPYRLAGNTRWTRVLQELPGSEEYEIIEEGLGGRTTVYQDDASPFTNGRDYLIPCVLSHYPFDLLIIMLGTNDLKVQFAPYASSELFALQAFLRDVLNPNLYEGGALPKVLLTSPIAIGDNYRNSFLYGVFDENSYQVSKELPRVFEAAAKMFGCEFMDASRYAEPSPIDSIHMDPENHRKLAEAFAEKIREIL